METQTRLSRHNKFISAENIIAILSVSSDIYIYIYSSTPVDLSSLAKDVPVATRVND